MGLAYQDKIFNPKMADRIPDNSRPLIFTNGVFDILHRGHITYLEEAKKLGKTLLVALNSDASTKKLAKGEDRPINTLDDRLSLIAALESVSLVTWFEDENPLYLIKKCRPDILVKGGDWPETKIIGSDIVKESGGQVISIPFKFRKSTTEILAKIRQSQ